MSDKEIVTQLLEKLINEACEEHYRRANELNSKLIISHNRLKDALIFMNLGDSEKDVKTKAYIKKKTEEYLETLSNYKDTKEEA